MIAPGPLSEHGGAAEAENAPPRRRRRKASKSPTQRSLALLRARGYRCAIVEHWNPFAHIRQDLFGFVDLLAIRKDETLAVQACARCDVSKRIQKIADAEAVHDVRDAGWRIVVMGWEKMASGEWECREEDVS